MRKGVLVSKSRRFWVWLISGAILAAAPLEAVTRRAFVTSIQGNGNLATWPGATGATALDRGDAICRARATAASLPNATTYRVLLSTASTDAYCHVQGLSGKKATACGGAALPGGGPWYLSNGITPFAGPLVELAGPAETIYRPAFLDEFGDEADYDLDFYWTGTTKTGEADSETCLGWTSSSTGDSGLQGHSQMSAGGWTHTFSTECSLPRRLLCLEPGASQPFVLGWSPAGLAFASSVSGLGKLGSWPQAGGAQGIAAGDAICKNLAAAAHLPAPESFVAWLSDGGHDARDRVTLDASFRRVDHYPIANSRDDLLDGVAVNSLHVDEHGSYANDFRSVYTGTFADGTRTTDHCFGWTEDSPVFSGTFGGSSTARSHRWTEGFLNTCNVNRRIYCFGSVVVLFWDGFESGATANWSATVP